MLHPPLAAVVWQAKLVGQPVWLHGSGSQPCASVPALPAAHWSPVAQVYPALQSTGAHPLASAPVAQSLSREQSLCGAGDTQKAPHAEETPDGSDVHT
jgi:hypothetical protein